MQQTNFRSSAARCGRLGRFVARSPGQKGSKVSGLIAGPPAGSQKLHQGRCSESRTARLSDTHNTEQLHQLIAQLSHAVAIAHLGPHHISQQVAVRGPPVASLNSARPIFCEHEFGTIGCWFGFASGVQRL